MEIIGLDKEFQGSRIFDNFESCIWNSKYCGVGDFELYIRPTKDLLENLPRYFVRQDCEYGMIITGTEFITDAEEGDHLIITGKSLESVLHRRIIWKQTVLSGNVEMAIRRLIEENVINPEIRERRIENFKLGEVRGFPEIFEKQITGQNLGEAMEEICNTYHYGYKVTLQNGNFVFDLYRGEDRSYSQNENPFVVFSPEFENLLSSGYRYDAGACKNVVLVAGEGEGQERRTASVGNASGLDRMEMYMDARNASSNNGEIGETQYLEMLKEDGRKALTDAREKIEFNGNVDHEKSYLYGEDYFLGDVVQVVNAYDIGLGARIREIIESEDAEGYKLIPTFAFDGEGG